MIVRHSSRVMHDIMTSWTSDGIEEIVQNARKSFKVEGIELPLPGTSWEPPLPNPCRTTLNRNMMPLDTSMFVESWDIHGTTGVGMYAENFGLTLVIGFCARNAEPRRGELQLHLRGVFESTLGCLVDTQLRGLMVINPYSLVHLFKQIS